MDKPKYKSKTIVSASIVILMAVLSFFGVGEKELLQTYDTISNSTGNKVEDGKELITILAGIGAFWGRTRVGKGKDE